MTFFRPSSPEKSIRPKETADIMSHPFQGNTASASQRCCLRLVNISSVILREVSLGCRNAPLISFLIRFHFTCQNLETAWLWRSRSGRQKRLLSSWSRMKGDIVKELHTVNGLGNAFNVKYFVANLTVWTGSRYMDTYGWMDGSHPAGFSQGHVFWTLPAWIWKRWRRNAG